MLSLCMQNINLKQKRKGVKMKGKVLSIPEKHQLRIARDTMKYTDAMLKVIRGPSRKEAEEIIKRLTGK